jgi:hypothetical protein
MDAKVIDISRVEQVFLESDVTNWSFEESPAIIHNEGEYTNTLDVDGSSIVYRFTITKPNLPNSTHRQVFLDFGMGNMLMSSRLFEKDELELQGTGAPETLSWSDVSDEPYLQKISEIVKNTKTTQ